MQQTWTWKQKKAGKLAGRSPTKWSGGFSQWVVRKPLPPKGSTFARLPVPPTRGFHGSLGTWKGSPMPLNNLSLSFKFVHRWRSSLLQNRHVFPWLQFPSYLFLQNRSDKANELHNRTHKLRSNCTLVMQILCIVEVQRRSKVVVQQQRAHSCAIQISRTSRLRFLC